MISPVIVGRGFYLEKVAAPYDSRWRKAALSLEKKASLSTALFNATRKYAPNSEVFLTSKVPWLASKFINRGRQLRRGVSGDSLGTRGIVQTAAEDLMLAPESGSLNNMVGLIQDAATRVKLKKNTFMHDRVTMDRLNNELFNDKKNLLSLKTSIKALKEQGQADDITTTVAGVPTIMPGWKTLTKERKQTALRFKKNLKELRREQPVGDLPVKDMLDEVQNLAQEQAISIGESPATAEIMGKLGRQKIEDLMLKADVDPKRTNIRQMQDKLYDWQKTTKAERNKAKDKNRSWLGRPLAAFGRTIYDKDLSTSEVSSKILGSVQLDDMYDPLAKNRIIDAKQRIPLLMNENQGVNVFGSVADGLAAAGESIYAPIEAAQKRYGASVSEGIDTVREGVLEWDPTDFSPGKTPILSGMGIDLGHNITVPPPMYLPPVPKVNSKRNLQKLKRKVKKKGRKKRRR